MFSARNVSDFFIFSSTRQKHTAHPINRALGVLFSAAAYQKVPGHISAFAILTYRRSGYSPSCDSPAKTADIFPAYVTRLTPQRISLSVSSALSLSSQSSPAVYKYPFFLRRTAISRSLGSRLTGTRPNMSESASSLSSQAVNRHILPAYGSFPAAPEIAASSSAV